MDGPKGDASDDAIATRVRQAAERALAEAHARQEAAKHTPGGIPEIGGRDGPEPVRYGDWEVKGLASDF